MTTGPSTPAEWVDPMLATLVKEAPPEGGGWIYQRKFDGLRAIAVRNGDEVQLWSRNHLSFVRRFPALVADLLDLPADDFTLDGEIVAYRGEEMGFETFRSADSSVVYQVFDLLHLEGRQLTGLPQAERGERLKAFAETGWPPSVRRVSSLTGRGVDLHETACREGWEGVVAKDPATPYVSGRSRHWLKLKCTASQELVVGGWTDPRGSRRHLGALLVGVYEGEGLRYAGKVGSGLGGDSLSQLSESLAALARATSPFLDAPRFRDAHWVEPVLVAEVAFAEWTADGRLRHPRFAGLRPDKAAVDVHREA